MADVPTEEQVAAWSADAEARKSRGHVRRLAASRYMDQMPRFQSGYRFILRCHTGAHYSITRIDGDRTLWRINVYPGNCRIYRDPHFAAAPFLNLPKPWTLEDVVEAVKKLP